MHGLQHSAPCRLGCKAPAFLSNASSPSAEKERDKVEKRRRVGGRKYYRLGRAHSDDINKVNKEKCVFQYGYTVVLGMPDQGLTGIIMHNNARQNDMHRTLSTLGTQDSAGFLAGEAFFLLVWLARKCT